MRLLLTTLAAFAAASLQSAPPQLRSPELGSDRRVTFRIKLPNAREVKLRGDQHLEADLTKGDDGVWSATVGPLEPSIYSYSFLVDGLAVMDPGNPHIKPERSQRSSAFEIPGDPPRLHEWQDVPHGVVHLHDYYSKPLGVLRRLRVYTPPGYGEDATRRYPVFYLFHGSGDNEATWTEFGHAHLILDNLIAQGKALPMLLVMPNGHPLVIEGDSTSQGSLQRFESDLLEAVVPLVDHTYRTQPAAGRRAICGLSMGGVQSLSIGLRHPDLFAWVGGMSAFVPDAETRCADGLNDPKINEKLKLLWHQIGKDDSLLKRDQDFDAILEKHGLKRHFQITEGIHAWPVWRGYLAELAPLLFR